MIVQALFSLILSLPLEAYQNFLDSSGLKSFFEIPIVVLSNSIGLIFSFVVAYQYRIDNKDKLFAGLLSMACYLLLIPIDVARQGSLTSIYTAMIDLQYMNSSGIFVAMISSLIFSKIYPAFWDDHLHTNKSTAMLPYARGREEDVSDNPFYFRSYLMEIWNV